MTKSDLINALAVKCNIKLSIADSVVTELFQSMTDTLASGNRVEIRGLCSFEIRDYKGYSGRNPKSGLEVTVAPKKSPFFKVGKELKYRIANFGNK